jgi:hypothetical protein
LIYSWALYVISPDRQAGWELPPWECIKTPGAGFARFLASVGVLMSLRCCANVLSVPGAEGTHHGFATGVIAGCTRPRPNLKVFELIGRTTEEVLLHLGDLSENVDVRERLLSFVPVM